MRKVEEYVGRSDTVMVMDASEKRRRGRPKRKWMNSIKHRDGVIGRRGARPGCLEVTSLNHRLHIKVLINDE